MSNDERTDKAVIALARQAAMPRYMYDTPSAREALKRYAYFASALVLPEGAPSLPPDMAILERCREICMRVSFDAEEAAKAKDATDYAAGYRDACVDIDEEIRVLMKSYKPQLSEGK